MNKYYLGDAVYAHYDGYQIWLTTEDFEGFTHKIALDPDTYQRLVGFAKKVMGDNEND
jgi:hypothetical protein